MYRTPLLSWAGLGFFLLVVGCGIRSSVLVATGLLTVGLLLSIAVARTLWQGRIETTLGRFSRTMAPVRFWLEFAIFAIFTALWIIGWSVVLLSGHDLSP